MRGGGIVLTFVIGLAVGVAGGLLAPRYAGQYLPELVRGKGELVEGQVMQKQRSRGSLLLTIQTPEGAILATFTQRIPEIDLLVNQGDRVTLSLPRYAPFVEDPAIERVKKAEPTQPPVSPAKPEAEAEPPNAKEVQEDTQEEKASR